MNRREKERLDAYLTTEPAWHTGEDAEMFPQDHADEEEAKWEAEEIARGQEEARQEGERVRETIERIGYEGSEEL
jgi:hypothetical protein